ncbi:potassium channel subfamily k [Holotrichia oblita]|uniref:Potassium channel subfamily k n=1 Tax=Holotrichia oblita TaxID=644536 RepID=A0ACB9TWA1_HOLOL|nr:potassium channel subfamily k [Holotrichia oblita]
MKKQNVRTLSLIVCTFTYLLIGAAVFDSLESSTEKQRKEVLQGKILLNPIKHKIESIVRRKYNITDEDFKIMETVVLKSEPHRAGRQWKFVGAFYYATTVLTTIGYGHSTPSTIAGKLFTMCYAMIGIPLGLVMFQSIGERVNRLSSVIIRSVKSSLHCRQTNASELDLICVVTTLSSLTIAGGAAAFSRYEGWSYFDSVYYCFITLTTIGFGDMVSTLHEAVIACITDMEASAGAVRLEGDVITANGSILSGHLDHQCTETTSLDPDDTSVCSCHCGCFTNPARNRSIKQQLIELDCKN